jgi:hypothetical protein
MRHNQGQNSKRARGRGRRSGGHNHQVNFNRNTTFDSNGPEGRLRGNAQQLFEKYTALAHDANAAGERISAEAFTQFADHYYRINQSILQTAEQQRKAHDERQQSRRRDQNGATENASESASDNTGEMLVIARVIMRVKRQVPIRQRCQQRRLQRCQQMSVQTRARAKRFQMKRLRQGLRKWLPQGGHANLGLAKNPKKLKKMSRMKMTGKVMLQRPLPS